jgi:butyryl-CoA dehydrogenase
MDFALTLVQKDFQQRIRAFLQQELAPLVEEIERAESFPMDFYKRLAANNLLAINFPKKYGGQDADCIICTILIEEMAKVCSGVAGTVTTAGMTAPHLLLEAGSEKQKETYLHGVATGETLTSFAITEPNSGSDVTNLETRAVTEGDYYRINGSKVFITNGSVANIFLVVARTGDREKEFSVFLVERNRPGFSVSKKFQKLGWACQDTTEISLNDVILPRENLVGPEGRGLSAAMTSIGFTRILLAATGLGVAESALERTIAYVMDKNEMGKPMARHQGIRATLARIAVDIEAARFLVYRAAWMLDKGLRHRKEAAMAKYYATELAKRVTKEMLPLYGIEGFAKRHQAAISFSDSPVFTIADGTSEIQLENISRELGLLRSGEMGL